MDDRLNLIDCIYEAAFVPEAWPDVLDRLAEASGSVGGAVILFEDKQPMRFTATGPSAEVMRAFSASGEWIRSPRIPHFQTNPFTGFVIADEYFGPEIVGKGPEAEFRCLHRLGVQVGTMIPMPTGEVVVFAFDRFAADGAYDAGCVAILDALCPHLSRAGLMAARLKLQRAQAVASALQAVGLPAAVLSGAGRVRSANDLFDAMTSVFLPTAFGGMAVADPVANNLFRMAVEAMASNAEPTVRSIPVKAGRDHPPLVVHVLPLIRNARDIFEAGDLLVAATPLAARASSPSPSLLSALFDIAPAEARLAALLAGGKSLAEVATELKLSPHTARTYLQRVFDKTGTHRQSELTLLLQGAARIDAEG